MAVRKKEVKTFKTQALVPEETEPAFKERMQVVTEVVEGSEVDETRQFKSEAETRSGPTPPDQNKPENQTTPEPAGGTKESSSALTPPVEKRKEVVEELFRSREPVTMPEISLHKKSTSKAWLIWAAVVVIVALVLGGALLSITRGQLRLPLISTKLTPTPTSVATPTPEIPPRGDLTIQVLNGAGKAGVAGQMKDFLEKKGYKVTDVGNAEEYKYEETEITVKSSKSAYLSLLKEDLKESYTIGTAAADLPEDVAYDARVIVGKK